MKLVNDILKSIQEAEEKGFTDEVDNHHHLVEMNSRGDGETVFLKQKGSMKSEGGHNHIVKKFKVQKSDGHTHTKIFKSGGNIRDRKTF